MNTLCTNIIGNTVKHKRTYITDVPYAQPSILRGDALDHGENHVAPD